MVKNFSNLAKEINLHIQEAEQILNGINPKKFMPRHTVVKLLKIKTKFKRNKNDTLPRGKKQIER